METTSSPSEGRLLDYLILVGPGRGVIIEQVNSSEGKVRNKESKQKKRISDWQNISTPVSTILCQFPSTNHEDFELSSEVAYFCQPEGCCIELQEPYSHNFMLTDTESNMRTYGMCMTFPHLFDPNMDSGTPGSTLGSGLGGTESICIQEWGILSVCILSHHPFFSFFHKCLQTLSHFIDNLDVKDLTWNALIRAQHQAVASNSLGSRLGPSGRPSASKKKIITEVEEWIDNLLLLPSPSEGDSGDAEVQALEVELQVDPVAVVCYPPKSHFPLLDLPLYVIFQKIGIHLVLEIYKLVLSEQKVILHSKDVSFSSDCVLCVVSLLYPLQYLYPIIPLLPTAMPTAENLLMVPTPFLIGVCDSFMKKVRDYQVAETWVINLDSKKVKAPQVMDHPLLDFPYSMLQLQADVRKALDNLETADEPDGNSQSTSKQSMQNNSPPDNHTHQHKPGLLNEVDSGIRLSFVQFLFNAEMLELMDQHLCIYRLFPRPVVDLRSSAFLKAYKAITPDSDFIQELMKTQCVEYFYQYSLNPSNLAFDEIRKGVVDLNQLSDKYPYFAHRVRVKVHQVTLYSPDSTLYQHMLSYKANLAESRMQDTDDSSSDWEVLTADYYDGDSEISASSSYYSDEGEEGGDGAGGRVASLNRPNRSGHHRLLQRSVEVLDGILEGESLEVKFHTPRSSKVFEESQEEGGLWSSSQVQKRTEQFRGRRGKVLKVGEDLTQSPSSLHQDSTPSRVQLFHSPDNLDGQVSSVYLSDDSRSYVSAALAGEGEEDGNFSERSTSDADLSPPRPRSNAVKGEMEAGVPMSLNRYTQMSLGNLFASQKEPEEEQQLGAKKLQRGGSLVVRRDRVVGKGSGITGVSPVPVWKSTPLVAGQSVQASVALEMQIYDLAIRIIEGQGLPWPKPSYLKRMASQEKTRILMLRLMEEKLGVREPGNMELATGAQIIAVGVTKSVYKGVLELLKYLLLNVEESIQKDSESSIFSVFLIFRLAFSTYIQPRRPKHNVIGVSLLNALNLNSFVTPSSPKKQTSLDSTRKPSSSDLPQISVSDMNEETKELHIIRKEGSSPMMRRSGTKKSGIKKNTSPVDLPAVVGTESNSGMASGNATPTLDSAISSIGNSPEPLLSNGAIESFTTTSPGETDTNQVSNTPILEVDQSLVTSEMAVGSSNNLTSPNTLVSGSPKDQHNEGSLSIKSCDPDHSTPAPSSSSVLSFTSHSPTSPSPQLLHTPVKSVGVSSSCSNSSPLSSASDSELLSRTSSPHSSQMESLPSTTPAENLRTTSPVLSLRRSNSDQSPSRETALSKQAILLSDLINSPRFYHPQEGQELSGCQFLYKDLMRSMVQSTVDLFHSRQFWNQLFVSTVTFDRSNLGWNEMTATLYTRYNSLTASHREKFGFEEDTLISVVLHNLLVYMLMVGLDPQRTMELIQRFAARTRLAIGEERLLQQTLKHIEKCIEDNDGKGVDINMLGLLSLYSELHPTVSYIVHYGTDMLAPVYKLQITDEVLILRRFPDDRICSRLWNDCITIVSYNKTRATVSVCYKDAQGEYYHHFHTKQFMKVYESLQALVSPGKVESTLSDEETDATPVVSP